MSGQARSDAPRLVLAPAPPAAPDALSALEQGAEVQGWVQAPDGRVLPVSLRLGAAAPAPAPPAPAPAPAPAAADDGDTAFRLRLELDVAHEQIVLFRTMLVLEALGGLLLIRQWLVGG